MPTQLDLSLLPALVPEQEFLSCFVATVLGPIEYREWKSQLERIQEMLGLSRVEETFQRLSLAQRNQAEQRVTARPRASSRWNWPRLWIWRRTFWTPRASNCTFTFRWIGCCCETRRAH